MGNPLVWSPLALAEAISNGLGNRQEERVDLLPDNCPEVNPKYKHEETRDIAAKESGLGSSATLRLDHKH